FKCSSICFTISFCSARLGNGIGNKQVSFMYKCPCATPLVFSLMKSCKIGDCKQYIKKKPDILGLSNNTLRTKANNGFLSLTTDVRPIVAPTLTIKTSFCSGSHLILNFFK